MPQDPPDHLSELFGQRAGVVVLAVACADRADVHRHRRVAVGRQVRKEMMFDLMAQVARHQIHQLAAGKVG